MSEQKTEEPQSYRDTLKPILGGGKQHFADALSTVSAEHLHARSRVSAVFNLAVHSLLGKYLRREKTYTNPQKISFKMNTVAGVMDCFQFEYEAIAISGGDGEGRKEVTKVLQLAAIGGGDETQGRLAVDVLNEGAKQVKGKQ